MILIITNKEDAHPTPVIEELNQRREPFFRLNTEALLTDYSFCWWNDGTHCDFVIEDKNALKTVKGSDITAVWDRRPDIPAELPIHSSEEIDKHCLKEGLGFLKYLRSYIKDIPSIGNIVIDNFAESKMWQLKVAQDVGFNVPKTIFSNNRENIVGFVSKFDSIILKSIENDNVMEDCGDLEYVFYSKKVTSKDIIDAPIQSFIQTANFAQNYISKKFELRITVVGDDIFTAKIDSQKLPEQLGGNDWRQSDLEKLPIVSYQIPNDIAKQCKDYIKSIGLNFGCFDFIVTPEDEYYFLECNPNGQWLWVELLTGMPIAKSVADFLITINKHNKEINK